jgi:hypothetical protein
LREKSRLSIEAPGKELEIFKKAFRSTASTLKCPQPNPESVYLRAMAVSTVVM